MLSEKLIASFFFLFYLFNRESRMIFFGFYWAFKVCKLVCSNDAGVWRIFQNQLALRAEGIRRRLPPKIKSTVERSFILTKFFDSDLKIIAIS